MSSEKKKEKGQFIQKVESNLSYSEKTVKT